MIGRNLGVLERVIRLLLGSALAIWVYVQPQFGWIEAIASICALFLVLNAMLARCYLWHALGLNSCDDGDEDCGREAC